MTEEKYDMFVGLYTSAVQLVPMKLNDRVATSAKIGTLYIERAADGAIKELRLEPTEQPPPLNIHVNSGRPTLDFGLLKTDGVCRLNKLEDSWEVVPAPGLPPFEINVDLDKVFGERKAVSVSMEMQNGDIKTMPSATDGHVLLKSTSDVFRFILK